MTTKDAVTTLATMLWAYCTSAQGFSRNVQKSASTSAPPGPTACPAGCCMKALVQMMKYPDSQLPAKRASAARKCPRRPSRRSPKTRRPRKLDSRKNANKPSIARVWPTTPPAYWEKRAQLVPNWNSIGIPVTTPTAKLRPKIRIQKRAASSHRRSPVRRPRAFIATMRSASPIVSWGNR